MPKAVALKTLYETLSKNAEKLYRLDRAPSRFAKKGYMPSKMLISAEPKGLYWAKNPNNIPKLIEPIEFNESDPEGVLDLMKEGYKMMEAVPLPTARQGKLTNTQYRAVLNKTLKPEHKREMNQILDQAADMRHLHYAPDNTEYLTDRLTNQFKSKYDLLDYPDIMGGLTDIMQTVQLNPNSVLAKIKGKKKDIYKILAITAAMNAAKKSEEEE